MESPDEVVGRLVIQSSSSNQGRREGNAQKDLGMRSKLIGIVTNNTFSLAELVKM